MTTACSASILCVLKAPCVLVGGYAPISTAASPECDQCLLLRKTAFGIMQPQAQTKATATPLQSSVNAKWQEWHQRRSLSPEPFQRPSAQSIKAVSGTVTATVMPLLI